MNKNVAIPLIAIVVVVLGFFWLKDTSKTGIKPQAVNSSVGKQPDINQLKDTSEDEKVLSSLLGALTGQSEIDERTEAELLDILFDTEASLKERQKAAFALAKRGGADILPRLEEILSTEDTPTSLKVAILEGLGYSAHPEAKDMMVAMLQDKNDVVVRAAIKGLSTLGGPEAISILSNIMSSDGSSDTVIAEAALGLGKIGDPDAYKLLVNAYDEAVLSENIDFQEDILFALGYVDIAESGDFFKKMLDSNTTDPSLRLAAIEAIQDSEGDTVPILLSGLNDPDSEVRAEAAWGLAAADDPGNISKEIETYLAQEQDAEVRKRLYQALGNQENPDLNFVNDYIYNESDMNVRVAGYDLLAKNISALEDENLITQFNERAIPELRGIALSAKNLSARLSAVLVLKKANTKEAILALEKIAEKSTDPKVVKATRL